MHRLELEIVHRTDGVIYKKNHQAPSKWIELKKQHLLIWAAVMCTQLDISLAKTILSFKFYEIPEKLTKYIPRSRCIILHKSIEYLFNRNGLEAWLIPSIWHKFRCYHGPKSKLANLTIEEFKFCEHCYEKFDITKDTEYLDNLCSILFRPRRFFGIKDDIRKDLTLISQEKRAKLFKKLNPALKWAIYLNYEGCRNFIISKNPIIFKPSKRELGEKTAKTTPWAKIIESAANGAFGPYEQTEKANLHKFLSKLSQQIEDFEERERNRKSK